MQACVQALLAASGCVALGGLSTSLSLVAFGALYDGDPSLCRWLQDWAGKAGKGVLHWGVREPRLLRSLWLRCAALRGSRGGCFPFTHTST